MQPALSNPNPFIQRAAYQALAVSAEGCQEHIRNKYLGNFLQILGKIFIIFTTHVTLFNSMVYKLGKESVPDLKYQIAQPKWTDL